MTNMPDRRVIETISPVEDGSSRRRLTLFLSGLTLVSNIITVFVLHYFPDDPFHLAVQISIYSYLAGGISVLGLAGAYKENATFVTIYANHLLLDALLYTVPRVFLMVLLSGMREGFCDEHVGAWIPSSKDITDRLSATLEEVGSEYTTDVQRCMRVLWGVQAAVAVAAVVTTTAQWMLAMRIRSYGKSLAKGCLQDSVVQIMEQKTESHVSMAEHSLI